MASSNETQKRTHIEYFGPMQWSGIIFQGFKAGRDWGESVHWFFLGLNRTRTLEKTGHGDRWSAMPGSV